MMTNERQKKEDVAASSPDDIKKNEQSKIISALIKAQQQIKPPTKEGTNPMFKSKYATLDAIYHACRKPLADNGLVLSHSVDLDEQGRFFLLTTLYHISGESMVTKFPMLIEKQTNQGVASARTYACRYATCNLLALPSDEDDDGNASCLTKEQTQQIESLVGSDQMLADRVLKGYERKYKKPVRSFSEIRREDFEPAINALKNSPKPIVRT